MTLRTTVAIVVVLTVISAGVAAALVLAGPSPTESDAVAKVGQPTNEPEALAAVTGGGTAEGIQVHGHWLIEVRDPDGSLVLRREFENALALGADALLASIFNREYGLGLWVILILS